MPARDDTSRAKQRLRSAGWYVRYTEWPTGHQVVLHRRSDTSVHLVTDWCRTEADAFAQALALADRHERGAVRPGAVGGDAGTPGAGGGRARRLDVTVLGNVREELVIRTPRLPVAGEVLDGELVMRGPGGDAIRRAIAAVRLGARVAVVSRVGGDPAGAAAVARLRVEGVDTAHLVREADARTALALVHQDRRGRTTTATAADGVAPSVEDVRAAEEALRESAVLVASLGPAPRCVLEAFRIARAHRTHTLLDCDPARKVPAALLRATDLAIVAARDARIVTGVPVTGRTSAMRAARQLLPRLRGGAVVLTIGRAVLLLTRNDEAWIPDPRGDWTDVREAGDAFSAMIAVALAEDLDLGRAARLAVAAAALAISGPGDGAYLPRRSEVAALASQLPEPEEPVLDGVAPGDAPDGAEARRP